MRNPLPKESLNQLFTEARTHHVWTDKPLSDDHLHKIYDLMKWAPTSMNSLPMRILFVKNPAIKEKVYPALMEGNVAQAKQAPVIAILAYDEKFYDHLPELFPVYDAKPMFANNAQLSHETAFRNASMQGAYFILAARSLGIDVGPMSGFNAEAINEAFFKGTSWKANFICALGYGDDQKLYPRGPRLSFEQACRIE